MNNNPGAGTGSSAGGPPAGAVVVPMEAAAAPAAAAAAAPPAGAAGARPAWTTRVSARVTWAAGAAAPQAGAAGAPVAAPVVAAAAPARAPPPAWTWLSAARQALAAALFLLGCAAAGLAFFAMLLPPADSRLLGKACTPPTDAEVAGLRAASEYLLLAASAQVLAATMALLVPARPFAVLGSLLGGLTAFRATDVLWMLVACHDSPHGALAFHFWLYYVVLWAAFGVALVVSIR